MARKRSRSKKSSRRATALTPNPLWYKDAIIYEIPVRSFYDADDDGFGDFAGLIQKLDYVQDLGVTAVWLLPFYPSPLRDGGYDIAEYTEVHDMYGTLRDFERCLDEAHKRGIRVITELVINHTSIDHPWFQRARRSPPGSKWRDFYVWSDTPERWQEARIIFQDFETSNWTWDPVAKAYYWHRFYSHQPDLNFDSPHVRKAIFQILDFWLNRGVDGLRLDAIPYLYERDGTNCENLPETHAFLRELRAHIDAKYEDRMLLAEANQWPEDAAAYFGDGDECHMNFHFPLMPRMFMSLQLESSFPILDIIEQTPDVPENCQWATFLRNHDELTLEMVTDEDRDFMYRMYAEDPQARLNLGIRRRLGPLLKERRKVELMMSLLFSMPGTPVLYYGDEIGMGDNIYLGDRDGVRTPMQWSAGRNAGFSHANPQRLYLPVIIDPEYHCDAINVEAQQNNSSSLLWWTKRLIALRKQHTVFGRGRIEFLRPRNNKVLAFFRDDGEERVLVVANLSRYSQYVELDLSEWRGLTPVELFGQTPFPRIGESPYIVTLAPHGFYWLSMGTGEPTDLAEPKLPSFETAKTFETLFEGNRARLERRLARWISERRWFRSKTRKRRGARIVDTVRLTGQDHTTVVTFVRVDYTEGDPETYVVPLTFVQGEEAWSLENNNVEAIVARLTITEGADGPVEGVLCDALAVEGLPEQLLGLLARPRTVKGGKTELRMEAASRSIRKIPLEELEPRPLDAEQSNSSILFGKHFIMKLLRQVEPGIHPEIEMLRYLSEKARFAHVPSLLGTIQWRVKRSKPAALAIVQSLVPSEGDAWRLTLNMVAQTFDRAVEAGLKERPAPAPPSDLVDALAKEIPEEARNLLGPFHALARTLGTRVGELHTALAQENEDEAFTCEPFSLLYQRSMYQSARALVRRALDALEEAVPNLRDETLSAQAQWVLAQNKVLDRRLRRIYAKKLNAQRIRCHGDLHLGQVLHTGGDFVIIDFEGEPARSISERRFKRSPLRDVAGMIRSFDYAASTELRKGPERPQDAEPLRQWARSWYGWASVAFLSAWLEAVEEAELVPPQADDLRTLLEFWLLEKCIYEVRYELDFRPAWLGVPLGGLRSMLEETDS